MNNSIIIFVLYFLYIQSYLNIIGLRKQIMTSKKKIEYPICGIRWAEGKSFSLHYTSCSRKFLTRKKVNDSTLPCASVPIMLQSSTSKSNSSSLKLNNPKQNLEDESNVETLSKQKEGNDTSVRRNMWRPHIPLQSYVAWCRFLNIFHKFLK